jgi:hypothetical protein
MRLAGFGRGSASKIFLLALPVVYPADAVVAAPIRPTR